MKTYETIAIVGLLGVLATLAFFFPIPGVNDKLVTLIVGGLLGYVARDAKSQSGDPK